MGGSQSAQRVTISMDRENEAFNIVRVSEDTIRTLRGEQGPPQAGKTIVKEESTKVVVQADEKLQQALNEERSFSQRLRQELLQRQHELKELNKKLAAFERDAKDAARHVIAEGDDKIKEAEAFYRQKIDDLMAREKQRQEDSTKIFKESLERLQQRFLKYSCHTACAETESKILQCYLQNPQQPLLCSRAGDEFVQCVDEYRAKMLTAKEMAVSAH